MASRHNYENSQTIGHSSASVFSLYPENNPLDPYILQELAAFDEICERVQIQMEEPQPDSRRMRTVFTPEQLFVLESAFSRSQYINRRQRLELIKRLGLEDCVITVWFQNRRAKNRRQNPVVEGNGKKSQPRSSPESEMQQDSDHVGYQAPIQQNVAPVQQHAETTNGDVNCQFGYTLAYDEQNEVVTIDNIKLPKP